eukprot:TRINITY_DN81107_c0_g1_i1.p1 TRINITY_DN81107_c0_g1~~TRINITY_DN81107_c0_g1_i1.p1  ORF type:complete len:247 (-),score=44.15 TRINITY_DN81107_c0_g1_i1:137-829(-)
MPEARLRLLGFPTSPFVRKVIVLLEETGVRDQVDVEMCINTPVKPNAELCAMNPLGKIPCLVTPDVGALYDSPVICEYLDALQSDPVRKCIPPGKERWQALRRQALGDGVMDAVVMIRYESHMRPAEAGSWPDMLDAQRKKVIRSLDAMEVEAAAGLDGVNIGTIAFACALGYLDIRLEELDWRLNRAALAKWYETFASRESMKKTYVDKSVDPLKLSGSGAFAAGYSAK